MQELVDDWDAYLIGAVEQENIDLLIKHERTGRPLGGKTFIEKLEKKLGLNLKKKKPGPKTKKVIN